MKKYIKSSLCMMGVVAATTIVSCSFDEVIDPNGPSVAGVEANASIGQLNELVIGIESTMRNGMGIETTSSGVMAREFYLFNADPRNTGDLLGKNGITLDNNSFYSVSQWNGNYTCIKNANLLIGAANNSVFITDSEHSGYLGFAKTIIAHELLQIIQSYGQARVDVADLENLGPVVNEQETLIAIQAMLADARTDLASAEFIFTLSDGFDGFNTPEEFMEFNQAITAMASVYQGDGTGALSALDQSYFDIDGNLTIGPKHIFGLGSGNQTNPVYRAPEVNGDQIVVHNSWINDAEAGDTRVVTKTAVRMDAQSQDDLNGTHETRLYASQTSSIDILRNEELILLYAEANILASDFDEAARALTVIRNSASLPDYAGMLNATALTAELLNQRRYSLWSENSRLYDVRRYNLEATLPIDRTGDQVFSVLPLPLAEGN